MQRKTAKKEAWRPQCAAPRLGYEQNQKTTCYCSYLGHQNEVTFAGGISARCPTTTTHHPTFQCEAMRVSAKPSQSGWVGTGRWVWITKGKQKHPGVITSMYVQKNKTITIPNEKNQPYIHTSSCTKWKQNSSTITRNARVCFIDE